MLRKGRFDEIFFVDLPDDGEREEILALYFAKYLDHAPSHTLMAELVELSRGFSGSDIEAAMHDLATERFLSQRTDLPSEPFMRDVFENVVPFSQTNPEDVAAIRAWGRERAVPAGRSGFGDSAAAGATRGGRRVVIG
jgi:SpoVK/Ycf46/Vps4 family AAA+-type ATPase